MGTASRRIAQQLGAALALSLGAGIACAQPASAAAGIYSCTTPDGRKLTSDRPIAECRAVEQRQHNSDGSLRRILPPTYTPEELAERQERERRAEQERLAQRDAVRRDKNLVTRYPDEATHRRAREDALDTVRAAMRTSENRLRELAADRKPLLDEAEFYKGKAMPAKLKQQLDANEAATEAQRGAILQQQAELERINRLYDNELARLRRLWAGAQPGSLGDTAPAAGRAMSHRQ